MRIISQIVPNGIPVATDIEATRQPGSAAWELASWGRPLALGVYPFFIRKNRSLIPVGTAFCISKLGISLTSMNGIDASFRRHLNRAFPGPTEKLHDLDPGRNAGMAVLHHRVVREKTFIGNIVSVDFIASSPATDVCCLFPQFQAGSPYLPLPLSFAAPAMGSRVVCVGFRDLSVQKSALYSDDTASGCVKLLEAYKNNFLAVEGRVTRIHIHGIPDKSIPYPCLTIHAAMDPGMIGGPVFAESGHVCGLISAITTHPPENPLGLLSPLYPALNMNIRFGGHIGAIRVRSSLRLTDLIDQGTVITDGTERTLSGDSYSGDTILN